MTAWNSNTNNTETSIGRSIYFLNLANLFLHLSLNQISLDILILFKYSDCRTWLLFDCCWYKNLWGLINNLKRIFKNITAHAEIPHQSNDTMAGFETLHKNLITKAKIYEREHKGRSPDSELPAQLLANTFYRRRFTPL